MAFMASARPWRHRDTRFSPFAWPPDACEGIGCAAGWRKWRSSAGARRLLVSASAAGFSREVFLAVSRASLAPDLASPPFFRFLPYAPATFREFRLRPESPP